MFSLSILVVFGVIINVNGHIVMKLLHNMHEKFHPNHGHHGSIHGHSGPGRYPPFESKPQFGQENSAYGPPPIGFSSQQLSHQNKCQYVPCHFPYPNNGQSSYSPSTININNINANSQQDTTSISSQHASNVNGNGMTTASNVPNYSTGIHGHGSDFMTNSQSAHGVNQGDFYHAALNGHSTNQNTNNNAFSSPTSQTGLNEFGSMFGSTLNNLATLSGQANLLNANSHQGATGISSQHASNVNVNGMTTASNVPNHSTGIHGHGSDFMTNSQSVHGVNQGDNHHAASSGHSTNQNTNNNAFSSSTSQKGQNEFGSLNNLATLNGQTNHLNAQTTNFNSETTKFNSETTNMNLQTTNFNGNSNNAMLETINQFGADKNALNAMNHIFNGAETTAANPYSNNVNHLNNNILHKKTVPAYTELPPASSTTNRAGMEYDIDIRFGDNQ